MTAEFHHFGPTDDDSLGRADRLVLHVDPDEATRVSVAAALTGRDAAVDVVAVPDTDLARTVLDDLRVDCVVVGDVDETEFLADVTASTALYTATDASSTSS